MRRLRGTLKIAPTVHHMAKYYVSDTPTTTKSKQPLKFVTVTHPSHPFYGQKLENAFENSKENTVLVRLPDNSKMFIDRRFTDLVTSPDDVTPETAKCVSIVKGIREMAEIVERIMERENKSSTTEDSKAI